jgi:signal transduction histidine kinase/CheY-like chemotaxis protein
MILIVEDSLTQAESLRHSLESNGYQCVVARNGKEALELAHAAPPALIISDVMMPEMDGFKFCRRVKSDEKLKDVPVVLLTSLVEFSDVIRGLECGADHFVTKPYEEDYLLSRVRYLLENRQPYPLEGPQPGIELEFGGERHVVTAAKRQILNLLLSTYDQAVQINRRLKRRERELEATNARLAALHALGVTVSGSLDLNQILEDALDRLSEFLGGRAVAVCLVEEESLSLRARRNLPDELFEAVNGRRADSLCEETTRMPDGRALLRVPLRAKGATVGLLLVGPPDGEDFGQADHELLAGVASQLAVAIENARLYEAAQQDRANAEDANRAKDAFLATVTHELRSPLNAMLGWAHFLLTKPVDEPTRRHALEVIEQSARTQSRLIEDLLDTARIASGKMRIEARPVDLVDVVASAMEVVRPAAEAKSIELRREFDARANIITGDPDRLQQVVWNLLSNAIKFTPEGGHVEVRLERADPHARVTVSDTGRGITPEFLPHVFERFSQQPSPSGPLGQRQATRRRSGLGLGLALAKHLVELHGGTIEAASEGEGRGATFTVNLPIRAVRPKARDAGASEAYESAHPLLLDGVRALVVDDDDDARDLLATVLRQYGGESQLAASAEEALALLGSGEQFDVLISDIGMPGESGYDLLRRVRALAPAQGGEIPALALTAFGRGVDRSRALAAGFQQHLPKPVEPAELAQAVAGLTGRSAQGKNA